MPVPVPATRAPAALRLAAVAALSAILLGACGSAGSTGTQGGVASASPAPTFSPIPPGDGSGVPSAAPSSAPRAALLLEVHTEGGFINPAASIGALPTVAVDTDGRIYTPAVASGDTPMILAVDVRDTGPAGAAAILAAAEAAGLAAGTSGTGGVAADTGTTVVTLEVNGSEVVTRIVAGPVGPGGPGGPGGSGLPGASPDPSGGTGAPALALVARLTDPTATWGAAIAPAASRLAPTGYRVWVAPAGPSAGSGPTAVWPLSTDPATFGSPAAAALGVDGLRSGVVTGAEAAALAGALGTAAAATELTASGHSWRVWVRPLLPDEVAG